MKLNKEFFIGLAIAGFLSFLAYSITTRKFEAKITYIQPSNIAKFEPKTEMWKDAYPRQYDSYMEMMKVKDSDLKSTVAKDDELEENPNLVILWAGYGFSKDYNKPRAHVFSIEDIHATLRTGAPKNENDGPMPSTCWTCKSPDVPRVMEEVGLEKYYGGKWASKGEHIVNPISCANCHDAKTMNLKIVQPALVQAFDRMGKDIEKSSYQDKRTLVCAQCHVEYYFKGKNKTLTFPWDKGQSVEAMEEYYDAADFKDWTHKISKAPMLKAQHPGYETWQMGTHGKNGVSCVDCHMPYKTEGGIKITDHRVQSPLNNIANACLNCHRTSEDTLISRVNDFKVQITDLKHRAEEVLVAAHFEAKAAWEAGATKNQMKAALQDIRHSQWRWDYAVAAHGAFFHAPEEMLRVLGTSIHKGLNARLKLQKILLGKGVKSVKMPDVSSKSKAQKVVGLDYNKLKSEKDHFLKTVVPTWMKKYEENYKMWKVKKQN
jgi:nitrite reductase (cytochrome c-552)